MSGVRERITELAVALNRSPLENSQAAKPRANRLRRSSRPSPVPVPEGESPRVRETEFKTPTRILRSRPAAILVLESPHNDSDVHQDIVWDCSSPSPHRLGKRGTRRAAGAVNISEIVSRIAPEHGRPEASEPSLHQWIGDSAAIPCTPDIQEPRTKRKSPRPNGVNDLLKLARAFDLNLFRCDKEDVEDVQWQSPELLSEDVISDLGNEFFPLHPGQTGDKHVLPDQHLEDDLDFLFDGPTQHMSRNLSQASLVQPSQIRPMGALNAAKVSGKLSVSMVTGKGTPVNVDFEDDWENDDLLNDSLVLEMTQNPQKFLAPKLCSTQKPTGHVTHCQWGPDIRIGQSASSKQEKENMRLQTNSQLETDPDSSVNRIQNLMQQGDLSFRSSQHYRFSVKTGPWCPRRTSSSNPVETEPQKQPFSDKTSTTQMSKPSGSQKNRFSVETGPWRASPSNQNFSNKPSGYRTNRVLVDTGPKHSSRIDPSNPVETESQKQQLNLKTSACSNTEITQYLGNKPSDSQQNRFSVKSGPPQSWRTGSSVDIKPQHSWRASPSVDTRPQHSWRTGPSNPVNTEPQKQQFTLKTSAPSNQNLSNKPSDSQENRSSVDTRPQHSWRTGPSNPVKSEPQKLQSNLQTSAPSNTDVTQSFTDKLTVHPPAVSDFPDDDLDSLFSSDPVWDDSVNDELLCELCEDLENHIESLDNAPAKQAPVSNHQISRTWDSRNQQPFPWKPTPAQTGSGLLAGTSLAPSSVSTVPVCVDSSNQSLRLKTVSGPVVGSGSSSGQEHVRNHQFTFKRPNDPAPNKCEDHRHNKPAAVGKCSEAEIELKKQQAMERRRRRLQTSMTSEKMT